jgi:hypothetical protein
LPDRLPHKDIHGSGKGQAQLAKKFIRIRLERVVNSDTYLRHFHTSCYVKYSIYYALARR